MMRYKGLEPTMFGLTVGSSTTVLTHLNMLILGLTPFKNNLNRAFMKEIQVNM